MMKTNPLLISADAIFITGPLADTNGLPNPAFKRIQEYLYGRGFASVGAEFTNDLPDDVRDRGRASYLSMCEKVVTLHGWEHDELSKRDVIIARAMGKKVIHAEVIEQHLDQMQHAG